MKPRCARGWLWALAGTAAACGRSDLLAGDVYPTSGGEGGAGVAGRGGTAGAKPSGGVAGAGSAGKGGGGSAAGTGGSAPVACSPPRKRCGDVCVELSNDPAHCGACNNECGPDELCALGTCSCDASELEVVAHSPKSAAVAVDPSSVVAVTFNCAFAKSPTDADSALVYGSASGPIATDITRSSFELRIDPSGQKPYFGGERLTVLLPASLAGPSTSFRPYLWQFQAAVSATSPGQFGEGSANLTALDNARVGALGDLDLDGDLDLVVRGTETLVLLRNRGDATFDTPEALTGYGTPVMGDIDNDGDLDVANGDRVLLNDGQGQFSSGPAAQGCVAMADVDGDADLDCLAHTGYGGSMTMFGHVLLNDGDEFEVGPQTPFGFECDTADLDGDGDLDAVCVSPVAEAARVFINDGVGGFSRAEQVLGEVGARGIALGDLDGDSYVDVVVSQWKGAGKPAPNLIFLNDGQAHFKQAKSIGSDGGSLSLGDVDGDGDLDALFTEIAPYGPTQGPYTPIAIYDNDGRAHFTRSPRTLADPAIHWFKLADLDGDRDLDAFVFHQLHTSEYYSAVWLNE
jgi:hypothetical protein